MIDGRDMLGAILSPTASSFFRPSWHGLTACLTMLGPCCWECNCLAMAGTTSEPYERRATGSGGEAR